MDRLFRSVPAILIALLTVATAVGGLASSSTSETPRIMTLAELSEKYAGTREPLVAPRDMDLVQTQNFLLNENQVLGRAPNAWVDWAHASFNFNTLPTKAAPTGDLVSNVVRLNGLLGVQVTAAQRLDMERQAAAMDPVLRASFTSLVATVVDAYAAQMPLAADLIARFPTEFDPFTPFVTIQQREEMTARAADVVAALNAFRLTAENIVPQQTVPLASCPPLFADPEGLIILGNTCDDTYTRSGTIKDPVLLVELGGADTYLNSAGGADPAGILAPGQSNLLVLSVVADVAGNDHYTYDGAPSTVQGAAAIGAIGILADAAGDDVYFAKMTRSSQALSVLTSVQYYFDGGMQGYGFGGVGIQLDGDGDDTFDAQVASTQGKHIWLFGQGFGAAGGLGLSSDLWGTDKWLTTGLGITGGTAGFQGDYSQGTGFYAGVGIMTDTGLGNDKYQNYDNSTTTDYYAQGFGAFGGLGIMTDDGGNDAYVAVSQATNSWINPLLHCAYGTGSLYGVGVFIDGKGDDTYFGKTTSTGKTSHVMDEGFGGIGEAVGIFVDVSGNDVHQMQGDIYSGRGKVDTSQILNNIFLGEGGNIVGFYLDSGGVDQYIGGPGADGTVWVLGADVNLVPNI